MMENMAKSGGLIEGTGGLRQAQLWLRVILCRCNRNMRLGGLWYDYQLLSHNGYRFYICTNFICTNLVCPTKTHSSENLEDSLINFDQKNQHQLEIGNIEVTISMIAHPNFDLKTKALRDSKPEFRPENQGYSRYI